MGLTRPRAHQLQDIDYKQTARAVTTSNIANLSGGAPATVDGVSLALRDRVLVTGQSTGSENGIYYVTTVGAGSNGTWARSLDADATGEVSAGMIIMITEGTTYADEQFKLTTDDPITIGSTTLTFIQVGNAAFGTIAVSGQDNLVADTIGDTLTVVAGTNLTATTTAGTDTITLTPSLTPAITSLTATGNISAGNIVLSGGITSTSSITIDASTNDTDISFKGTDGGVDITALLLDMSSGGRADFNNGVTTPSYFWMKADNGVAMYAGANFEIQLSHVHNTGFRLTETGGGEPTLQFVDANEAIGSDGTNLKLTSGGSVITVPISAGNMVVDSATQTLTSKTLTNPTINAFSGTGDGSITGNISATNFSLADSGELQLGSDADANIKHTGSDLVINETTGDIVIRTYADNKDVTIMSDDGSGGVTNYLVADGSTGAVKLKHYGTNVFETTSTGALIENTSTSDALLITTTEDSSSAGPVIALKRNSSSPADADYLGQLKFKGENDADQEVVYAKITGKIQDASDGSEDGLLEFANRKAGSNNINMRLRSDSLQLLNGTNLQIREEQDIRLYDSDSSNYLGFKAPSSVASDVVYTLPADGSNGQVLSTNGSGVLSFVDNSGGSSGSSFPNCTVTPLPGSEGNFDLAKQFSQEGSVETPFESGGTDAFGVNLGEIFTMMDPVGSIPTATDLGVLS